MLTLTNELIQYKPKEKIWFFISLIILFFIALLSLFPFYWMIVRAFQPTSASYKIPPDFFPVNPTLFNFERLFAKTAILRWFINSCIVAGSCTFLTLMFASMSGYAFAKKRFPGRQIIFWVLMTAMMFPRQVMLIPLFILMNRYNLYNTHPGMFLPMVANPLGLFMMRQFMQGIPDDIIQSAKIDGAGEFLIYRKIILPMSLAAFGAVGILYFVNTWNDYLWQLVMSKNTKMFTLPVGIATISKTLFETDYGLAMAGSVIGAIPMIAIFLAFQKYFISGITLGALKG